MTLILLILSLEKATTSHLGVSLKKKIRLTETDPTFNQQIIFHALCRQEV